MIGGVESEGEGEGEGEGERERERECECERECKREREGVKVACIIAQPLCPVWGKARIIGCRITLQAGRNNCNSLAHNHRVLAFRIRPKRLLDVRGAVQRAAALPVRHVAPRTARELKRASGTSIQTFMLAVFSAFTSVYFFGDVRVCEGECEREQLQVRMGLFQF